MEIALFTFWSIFVLLVGTAIYVLYKVAVELFDLRYKGLDASTECPYCGGCFTPPQLNEYNDCPNCNKKIFVERNGESFF